MHTTTKSTTATNWSFLFLIIYNIFIIYNISNNNNNNNNNSSNNNNNSLIYLELVLFQEEFSVLRLNFGFGDGVGLLFFVLKKVKSNFVIFGYKLERFSEKYYKNNIIFFVLFWVFFGNDLEFYIMTFRLNYTLFRTKFLL